MQYAGKRFILNISVLYTTAFALWPFFAINFKCFCKLFEYCTKVFNIEHDFESFLLRLNDDEDITAILTQQHRLNQFGGVMYKRNDYVNTKLLYANKNKQKRKVRCGKCRSAKSLMRKVFATILLVASFSAFFQEDQIYFRQFFVYFIWNVCNSFTDEIKYSILIYDFLA